MTISKLNKKLEKLISQGFGRRSVVINKNTFSHPLESDGCCMLDVTDADIAMFNIMNDDGGITHGEDGHEKFKQALILIGS